MRGYLPTLKQRVAPVTYYRDCWRPRQLELVYTCKVYVAKRRQDDAQPARRVATGACRSSAQDGRTTGIVMIDEMPPSHETYSSRQAVNSSSHFVFAGQFIGCSIRATKFVLVGLRRIVVMCCQVALLHCLSVSGRKVTLSRCSGFAGSEQGMTC